MKKRNKILDTLRSIFFFPLIYYKIKKNRSPIFFIFPSWQIGGSERVHADIMALFEIEHPMCIISEPQKKGGLLLEFKKYAMVNCIWRWGIKASFKQTIIKILAVAINKHDAPSVMGSNNRFFYDLIPYLKEHVRIIDLTHSITPDKNWCEVYSLPYVNRLYKRIVLGESSFGAFKDIYEENHVPAHYLTRFKIIHNKVSTLSDDLKKTFSNGLNILFVARNSLEKRLHLIFNIIDQCVEGELPVKFTVISDVDNYTKKYDDRKVTIIGLITDKVLLNRYYSESHLILLASAFEGFPMVLAEGMAQGVVPISTDVGEIPYFISENQRTGFLINGQQSEYEIVDEFVKVIKKCVAYPEIVMEFSENAREVIKENFSPEKFEKSYRELILRERV